jgi:hypothetical protein
MVIAHRVRSGTAKDMTVLAHRLEAAGWRVKRGRIAESLHPDGTVWDFHLLRQMIYPLNQEAEAVLMVRPLREIPPAPATRTPLV